MYRGALYRLKRQKGVTQLARKQAARRRKSWRKSGVAEGISQRLL